MPSEDAVAVMNGCRWVAAPTEGSDRAVETWNLSALVGFEPLRIFWLTNLADGQWRGRHAHRESILATFAVKGSCRLTLDNGKEKQTVNLQDDGPGLLIGPWVWHDLYDFSRGCVILVVASTVYDEAEYIRDYDAFVREARARDNSAEP